MAMTLDIIGSLAVPWGSAAFRPYLTIGLALKLMVTLLYYNIAIKSPYKLYGIY
jgi:hypothetical protein